MGTNSPSGLGWLTRLVEIYAGREKIRTDKVLSVHRTHPSLVLDHLGLDWN